MVTFPARCALGTGQPLTAGEARANPGGTFCALTLGDVLIPAFKAGCVEPLRPTPLPAAGRLPRSRCLVPQSIDCEFPPPGKPSPVLSRPRSKPPPSLAAPPRPTPIQPGATAAG